MPQLILPGKTLHYVQTGQKSRSGDNELVMLHGLAANLSLWFFGYAPSLSQDFHVTMVDLRGHGRSTMPKAGYTAGCLAEDLYELINALGIERAHFVGHSFGGAVVTNLASSHPEKVSSLTIIDTRFRALQQSQRSMTDSEEVGWELLERVAQQRLQNPANAGAGNRVFGGRGGLQAAKRWLDLLTSTSAREDFSRGDGLSCQALRRISIPVLAVYGERSPNLLSGRSLCDHLPQVRFVLVPNAGHFFPINRREVLLGIMRANLSQYIGGRTK